MRELVTIMFTDIEGYSALMQKDEEAAVQLIECHRRHFEYCMLKYGGTVIHYYGDGTLSTFNSVLLAVKSAIELQQLLRNDIKVPLRIGIHIGDVIKHDSDIVGDAINLASRIESLAIAGSILISQQVYDQLQNQTDIKCKWFGKYEFKNIEDGINIFAIEAPGIVLPDSIHQNAKLAVLPLSPNLPTYTQNFIGRSSELNLLENLLEDPQTRLLTLLGAGGLGKTRIAIELGRLSASKFRNGVVYIPLDGVENPDFIYKAIGQGLHLREHGDLTWKNLVINFLAKKQMLLIIDNFEHLLSGKTTIEQIIRSCQDVKFLITSRSNLDLLDEKEYQVRPFKVPTYNSVSNLEDLVNNDAIALFLQKARLVRSNFSLDKQNIEVILKICQNLEGLPLAIELAASRLRLLSPHQILDRMQDLFSLLKSNRTARKKRHQTIFETIKWSYDLLSEEQQRIFRAYSLFNVSFSLKGAQAIMPQIDALDALEHLLNNSLIQILDSGQEELRFGMLRVIREFGQNELAKLKEEENIIKGRYDLYYLRFLEQIQEPPKTKSQSTWLEKIDDEIDNLRFVQSHLLESHSPQLRIFLLSYWKYFLHRGFLKEGYDLTTRTITLHKGHDDELQGKLLAAAGTFAHNLGIFKEAKNHFSEALKIFVKNGIEEETCRTLNNLAWAEFRLGGYVRTESYSDAAIELIEKCNLESQRATALNNRAWVAMFRGYLREAMALQKQIFDIYEVTKDPRGLAFAKTNIAWTLIEMNKTNEAQKIIEEALHAFEVLGDKQLYAFSSCIYSQTIGEVRVPELLSEAISTFHEIGDGWGQGLAYQFLATHYLQHPEITLAKEALKQSFLIRNKINDNWGKTKCHLLQARIYRQEENIFEVQRHLGQAYQLAEPMQAPGLLKEILGLQGDIEFRNKDLIKSKEKYRQALNQAKKQGNEAIHSFKILYGHQLKSLELQLI